MINAQAAGDTDRDSLVEAQTPEFSWKTVRVTYIVPLPEMPGVPEPALPGDTPTTSSWAPIGNEIKSPRPGGKGLLSKTLEAEMKGAASQYSQNLLGKPMARALGFEDGSLAIREKWTGTRTGIPGVADWDAERITFSIGSRTSRFLIVGLDVKAGTDLERFLVQSKEGPKTGPPGALKSVLCEVGLPALVFQGDGRLRPPKGADELAVSSRLYISTVTMAVQSGPGVPPALQSLRSYENWGDTPTQKWSYFLATHNRHSRRLPPDSKAYADAGFLERTGAYEVRVEPFGTSVVFADDVPNASWDQLKVLRSGTNPFVELALLSYWQHACLEYFTDELAAQARSMEIDKPDLKTSLKALRDFGDSYFFFRNCIWFDNVPNQPEWTEYLQKLQQSLGDREAFARLATDYNDWTSHLGNRVALEEEERKDVNERQVREYSTLIGAGGLALGSAAILVEPATPCGYVLGVILPVGFLLWFAGIRKRYPKSPRTAVPRASGPEARGGVRRVPPAP
ncbi:hypothetical protein [Arthrobacter sp. zg-Y1171]|uniref:hypothetical protein n=1 Tax=Arthrobacter sp. zg-Y1171 TaxID=2964610 RepID=UPI00210527CC|nr:hypothetical protein [Arthrobacter sp. zg-Y1171]MCQ1996858.1 hypothetical protein [Arthrobacter sp. zg-Y1171]UWX82446.1 hypothetical protein N2L00_03165 [Arthrobacter sp. zg-Y1171]